jgi:hypothetical protein
MTRPFTDITTSISANAIKNGSSVCSTLPTGKSSILNTYVKNIPIISDIQSKYGNKFYNGIFVNVLTGDLNGGAA